MLAVPIRMYHISDPCWPDIQPFFNIQFQPDCRISKPAISLTYYQVLKAIFNKIVSNTSELFWNL